VPDAAEVGPMKTARDSRTSACPETAEESPRAAESKRPGDNSMERAIEFPAKILSRDEPPEHNAGLFSIETVLNLEKLIFAGSPLPEVLKIIARLVESQG
jgi:hypothetical protein